MTDQGYSTADLLGHLMRCGECNGDVRTSFLHEYPEVPIHEVVHELDCPAVPRRNRKARRQMRQRRAGKR